MKLPPIILASASPRRSELLRAMGVEFKVVPSDATEEHTPVFTARELAQVNAFRKARAVARQFPDALVIGADTLVYLGTTPFGKPSSREEAREMLKQLQGKTHQVITGVCLMHLASGRQRVFCDRTDVTFRPLGTDEIQNYLAQINPLDKAGAYAIQEHGAEIVHTLSGSFSNVVGLPVERLQEELLAWENFIC